MLKTSAPIYLASKSPRRKKLLKIFGIEFKTFNVELSEEVKDGEHPIKTVKRLSLEKNKAAEEKIKNGIIITADTIVVLNKRIIGKPASASEAAEYLKLLSGKTHIVYTGFAVKNLNKNKLQIGYEKTFVTFHKLLPGEINSYVATGSPMDKAGAYGIQDDFGAVFIKKINGCYYNVVGLPLAKLYHSLLKVL